MAKLEARLDEAPLAGREPITVAGLKKLVDAVTPAVCKIVYRSGTASGFLCVYKRGFTLKDDMYVLVTNNHVISDISLRSLKSYIFEFQSVSSMRGFQLTKEILISPWTDGNLDATVIGIKQGMAGRMMNQGARFIEMGTAIVGNVAAVIGHPEGDETSIDYGKIEQINNEYQILHRSSTKPGSSGSPLVTMEGKVIGIHKGSFSAECNEAVHLEFVMKRYILDGNQTGPTLGKNTRNLSRNFLLEMAIKNINEDLSF